MARKSRIQYPGAIFHILPRGNYRKDLFTLALRFFSPPKSKREG